MNGWLASCVGLVIFALSCSLVSQAPVEAPAKWKRTLSVTVRGPLLERVPNATVELRRPDWSLIKTGAADGMGEFVCALSLSDWVYCCARAPGMTLGCERTETVAMISNRVHCDLRLHAAAVIRGRITSVGGDPIAGAQVIAVCDAAFFQFKGVPEEALSDPNGAYVLKHAPLGWVDVRASAPGHELGEVAVRVDSDARVDVALKPGRGRTFAVTLEGAPGEVTEVITCSFTASRGPGFPKMKLPSRLSHAVLDRTGRCRIDGLPATEGRDHIMLHASGMDFRPQGYHEPPETDREVRFVLERGMGFSRPAGESAVRGLIRTAGGAPLGGVSVHVIGEPGWFTTLTDAAGRFVIGGEFRTGEALLFQVDDPDWVLEGQVPVYRGGGLTREVKAGSTEQFVATRALAIHGSVRSPAGIRTTGLLVELEEDSSEGSQLVGCTTVDDTGAFRIGGLSKLSGKLHLRLRSPDLVGDVGPLVVGAAGKIDLVLEPSVAITGRVTDADKPVVGARLEILPDVPGVGPYVTGHQSTMTDAQGRYAFRVMGQRSYLLRVDTGGWGDGRTREQIHVGRDAMEHNVRVTIDGK